jgi:hypothetical protein
MSGPPQRVVVSVWSQLPPSEGSSGVGEGSLAFGLERRGGVRSGCRRRSPVPLPTHNASSYRSVVEQIFQDRSRAAGAFLATEIDVGRHARPAVPELVCGISR